MGASLDMIKEGQISDKIAFFNLVREMASSIAWIIRIQSNDGTKRIEVNLTDTTKSLYEKVHSAFEISGFTFSLHKTRDRKNEIISSGRRTLKSYKFVHGDMVFLFDLKQSKIISSDYELESKAGPSNGSNISEVEMDNLSSNSLNCTSSYSQPFGAQVKGGIIEEEVDQILLKMDGKVQRERNPMLCRHLGNSKCIHCTSLDPWDETVLKDGNIKHMSFHSYLRKMNSGVDKGKFTYLEDISCKIKPGCKDHPPWPLGICSKCQPSAVILNRQTFRHIDNVTFENPQLVERFINYWRVTGHQRVGLLYGRRQPHLDVPLGIKASVAAIYEPPQEGSRDYVKLLPDYKKDIVEEIARGLGLICVGWIFTDLVPLDANSGTVKYLRNAESFFLSAHEVITAAHFQSLYPNPCKVSPNGYFGSKFATVIVTGDKENQVHMEGYQVSNQCQALVRDSCLIPTKDSPELAYVKESSPKQYVPDVKFTEKDQYGNEVLREGRPLPVEYLLLDCPVSTPNDPIYTFTHRENVFPVENRLVEGHLQDFSTFSTYYQSFKEDEFLEAVSDFHLLIFLSTMDTLPLKDFLAPLLEAINNKDSVAALNWKQSEEWATVEQLIAASGGHLSSPVSANATPVSSNGGTSGVGAEATSWTCSHCTFINQTIIENCEMCHLPR